MPQTRGGRLKCTSCTLTQKKYNCPICMDYLLPPVYQCTNGHLICEVCHVKVKTCPQCRDPFVGKKIRNLAVEEIVRDFLYDCKNVDAGCQSRLKYDEVRDHELDCKHSVLNYCECIGLPSCDEKVGETSIIEHLKTIHRIRGTVGTSELEFGVDVLQTLTRAELDRWNASNVTAPPFYLAFDSRVFFLKTFVDIQERCLSWMLCVAGSQKSAEKYLATIMFLPFGPNNTKSATLWQGQIYSFEKSFHDVYTLSVPLKAVMQSENNRARRAVEYLVRTRVIIQIASQGSIPNVPITTVLTGMISQQPEVTTSSSSTNPIPGIRTRTIHGIGRAIDTSDSSDSTSDSDNFPDIDIPTHDERVNPLVIRRVRHSSTATANAPARPAPYNVTARPVERQRSSDLF